MQAPRTRRQRKEEEEEEEDDDEEEDRKQAKQSEHKPHLFETLREHIATFLLIDEDDDRGVWIALQEIGKELPLLLLGAHVHLLLHQVS